MDRDRIIAEIRRMAEDNGGIAPGQLQFEKATAMPRSAWRGKFWRNWSDAVRAAGLTENKPNAAHERSTMIFHLVQLTRKIGQLPGYADLRLEREKNKEFPAPRGFYRLGSLAQRVELVRQFATENSEYADVLALLPSAVVVPVDCDEPESREGTSDGYVYMMRLGKHYKIGKTFAVPRRHREIALELPEKPDIVHFIRTDDPSGIEAYWHGRFENKRTNGEWFALLPEDVRAFKKRKGFM